jgi:hypothetical protein
MQMVFVLQSLSIHVITVVVKFSLEGIIISHRRSFIVKQN